LGLYFSLSAIFLKNYLIFYLYLGVPLRVATLRVSLRSWLRHRFAALQAAHAKTLAQCKKKALGSTEAFNSGAQHAMEN
jgi:hypothetical protein